MAETISFMKVCLETMVILKRCEKKGLVRNDETQKEIFKNVAAVYNLEMENLKEYERRPN